MLIEKLGCGLAVVLAANGCVNANDGVEASSDVASTEGHAEPIPEGERDGAPIDEEPTVTVSFSPLLSIANETLVFPLTRTPARRSLSEANLGELVVAYTRVGCSIDDPGQALGGATPVTFGAADPVLPIVVTISQALASNQSPEDQAQGTCLSLRSADGEWQPLLLHASRVTATDETVHVEFDVPAQQADAAAIFLPTYTSVAEITYTLAPP